MIVRRVIDWIDGHIGDSEPRIFVRPPARYRRRRLRLVYVLLAVALVALILTARCEGPGASAASERGQAPPQSSEAVSEAHSLPTDAFRRCATKALRGDYGELAPWQAVGYARGLEIGATTARVWTTSFFPAEGFPRGAETRWGYGCSERVVACNRLPARTFVWTQQSGIRQVLDTGARSNDARAERLGADMWMDVWEEHEGDVWGDENGGVRTVWIVPRRVR